MPPASKEVKESPNLCIKLLAALRYVTTGNSFEKLQEECLITKRSARRSFWLIVDHVVDHMYGGSQSESLMQGRAEQTCGKWRKQNVVAPPRSSAGRPTRWLWSLSRGQLPCDLSFVERLRFDGNPKPNTLKINTALPAVSGHK